MTQNNLEWLKNDFQWLKNNLRWLKSALKAIKDKALQKVILYEFRCFMLNIGPAWCEWRWEVFKSKTKTNIFSKCQKYQKKLWFINHHLALNYQVHQLPSYQNCCFRTFIRHTVQSEKFGRQTIDASSSCVNTHTHDLYQVYKHFF